MPPVRTPRHVHDPLVAAVECLERQDCAPELSAVLRTPGDLVKDTPIEDKVKTQRLPTFRSKPEQ